MYREYGKVINIWQALDEKNRLRIVQREYEYIDHLDDGREIHGTEDISAFRERQITTRWVYTWDGKRRNKGGYKWWTEQRSIRLRVFDVRAAKKQLLEHYGKYGAVEIQLRTE